MKQLEIRCDLLLVPEEPTDSHYIIEFQFYHDCSIFNRSQLSQAILWKHLNPNEACRRKTYSPREVENVIIFGSRSDLPSNSNRYPSTTTLFLDELLVELKKKEPESPLVAALTPLVVALSDLEKEASHCYDIIKTSQILSNDDREILNEIFLNILLQRFRDKSREEIRAMIAELTPIKETRVGKELLEEGLEQGREEGREEGRAKGLEEGLACLVRKLSEKGKSPTEIAELTDLPIEKIEGYLSE